MLLHSFAELAKVLGCKIKAEKVSKLATYANVEKACGRKAATIWAFLNDQEACKRYGPKGAILHDMGQLATVTGYEQPAVAHSVISLVTNGFARITTCGTMVKAA